MARFGLRRHSVLAVMGAVSVAATGIYATSITAAVPAMASGAAPLMPSAGQYFPVTAVKAADTRDGTGGVSKMPVAGGGTISFPVTGIGQVPASGVSDVFVMITAQSPSASGCLHDYSSDVTDPGICTVSYQAGVTFTNSDILQVSSTGTVSVTSASSGSTDVVVWVLGYYQDDSAPTAGDTYVPLSQAQIVDTRSGLGAPAAQIPAGGSLTVQVTGNGGIPSDAAGAALFVGAANASQTGYVAAYPAGGTPSTLAVLRYAPTRVSHDLYIGGLSSTGKLTLVNQGSAPVDLMVGVQGYLVSPSATEAGGDYQGVDQSRIVDTRNGTGGVPATPIPAGGSITFGATGVDNVPTKGTLSIAESVAALNATKNGYLSVYPANGTDPNEPGVNFNAADSQDNDMAAPLLSTVSPTGNETITNHSSGTVDVVVSVRGYYVTAIAPSAPDSVAASVSGSSATVTWSAPTSDGGAAITSYKVAVGPDSATVTVGGTTTQASLTGLAHASADVFTVTAVNAAGTSESGTWAPPAVLSGTVLSPNGTPVRGATVVLTPSDVPSSDPAQWTPSIIGTVTTDANGIWTFTVPPYSSLPSDAQADADANGGSLNLDASAEAVATVGTTTYSMSADAASSAYVGTSASPSGPVQVATSSSGVPAMTVIPAQADISSQDTEANEEATAGYQVNPTMTDASGNFIGNEMDAYTALSTDPYGYMNIAGPNNDGYSPFIATDGTDLSSVTATAPTDTTPANPALRCAFYAGYGVEYSNTVIWRKPRFVIVGEFHSNWDTDGLFKYEKGSESSIGVGISSDGEHFGFDGMKTFTLENSGEDELSGSSSTGGAGNYTSHHISINLNFFKIKRQGWLVPNTDDDIDSTDPAKEASGEPAGDNIKCGAAKYYVKEGGLYDPPGSTAPYIRVDCKRLSSGFCDPTDNSLWSNTDGITGYNNDLTRSYDYRAAYIPGSQRHCDSTGKGYLYKVGATIGNFAIEAETGHKTITTECIDFGTGGPRKDLISGKKDSTHWLWGSNHKVADGPKIFYSY